MASCNSSIPMRAIAHFRQSKARLFVDERCISKYRNHRRTLEMQTVEETMLEVVALVGDRDPQIILEEDQPRREDVV